MSMGIKDFAEPADTGISDFGVDDDAESLDLRIMSKTYTESDHGTVVHLLCRDADENHYHIEVDGHYPSFYIHEHEYNKRIDNHYAVHHTETHDEHGDRYTTLHDEPLVRVYTTRSSSVGDMRELFDETFEADVFFDTRWAIDNDVYTDITVDTSSATTDEPWLTGDMRVDTSAVEPCSGGVTPTPRPRKVVLDIEVASEDGVPDTDTAEWPVSTIVAWDNYSEEYVGWFLRANEHDQWAVQPDDANAADVDDLRVFDDESQMLYDFNEWVAAKNPNVLTGWFSNDFDIPYLVTRCKRLTTYNYQEWSPLGDVYIGSWDPVVDGVECIDMLGAYEKTQIHNLKDKTLDAIAEKELGGDGKVDLVDEGESLSHTEMWKQQPVEFLRYNKVDVELVHRIDDEAGAFNLLDNLREIAGVDFSDLIGGNFEMMDTLFLRKAQEYGYVLPTATKPDVGDYRGAYVYTPKAGLHEHAIYPDYSSLYPNMMYQCNISPETLVGTAEDLAESEYTEDDCVWTYIDTETPPSQKEDVELEDDMLEKLYFLKPSVEEGFIRSVLDDIMGMCDAYTGDMYAAAKRPRNSTYGFLGDSDSYGAGSRLFDWRLAEGTTIGGQKILKEGGRKFTEFVSDPDAEVIYGDTDSVVTTFPNAESGEAALADAMDAGEQLNEYLETYAADTFGLESAADSRMEIEIESYARGIFFKGKDDGQSEEGIKKRYVQLEAWNDSLDACASHDSPVGECQRCRKTGWLDEPELEIKGFEYVRSDIANVTADVQKATFDTMLRVDDEAAQRAVQAHVTALIGDIMDGEYDDGEIGIPFGISQSLSEYGSTDRTPQPKYRGAKFANEFLYGGDEISSGDRPLFFYIAEGRTGESLRSTYSAATKEDGRYVDAISVTDAADLPDDLVIDREKMIEKTIIDPMADIFRTLGWGVEWMWDAIEDAKSPEDYRDEDQSGLDAFSDPAMDAENFVQGGFEP